MSDRFTDWLALRANIESGMVSMALFGAFIVLTWESVRLYPLRVQPWARAVIIIVGAVTYVSFSALAIYLLVVAPAAR